MAELNKYCSKTCEGDGLMEELREGRLNFVERSFLRLWNVKNFDYGLLSLFQQVSVAEDIRHSFGFRSYAVGNDDV